MLVSARLKKIAFTVACLALSPIVYAADNGSQISDPFRINFAGYLPQAAKTAIYLSNNNGPINWSLDGSNCSGTETTHITNDFSSGDSYYVIDFSECTDLGNNLRMQVGSDFSEPFDISPDPYGAIKYEFFDYFRDHESSATFTKAKNNWDTNLSISFAYVRDAGDNGAYPTNTAEAAWSLINLLETYPEINNYYSNNFAGARTVYDQLIVLTAQFDHVFSHSRNLAIPKFHANVNSSWAQCSPHTSGTCISEPETKATYATARTLAAMSRLHLTYRDLANATAVYNQAQDAYSRAESSPITCNQANAFGGEGGMYPDNDNYSIFRNPRSFRDNCFPDQNNTEDDQYAALVELYIAAEKLNLAEASDLRNEITSHPRFNEASSFFWGAVVMEANLSLLTHEAEHNIDLSTFKINLLNKSNEIVNFQDLGYPGVTWDPFSNFWDSGDFDNIDNNVRWGSHRNALNDARILMAAAEISRLQFQSADAAHYARQAIKVLDHISGINPINLAMYTTSGYSHFEHSITRTHDGANTSDSWPGKLVLGPNNWTNADDPDMPSFGSQPGLKMFAVTGAGWSSREISIDANASLLPLVYFTTEKANDYFLLDPIGDSSTPTQSPNAPSNLSAQALSDTQIQLTWTDNSGNNDDQEDGFSIYINTSNQKPSAASFTTSVNAGAWTLNNLTADTQYFIWIEAFNQIGISSDISTVMTTEAAPAFQNLLTNGDFENGTTGWQCTNPQGSSSCDASSGIFHIDITNGGSMSWHVQPLQNNLLLENGKTYTFAFDARSTTNRNTEIKVERSVSPWEDFSQTGSGQQLTNQMQRFVYTFTMDTTLSNARVVLNIGANNNDIFFDNAWLVEGSVDPCNAQVGCNQEPETFDIVVNAGANGSISPGTTTVNEGGNQTFTITPNAGFHILDVLKNGVSLGPVSSVTFSNVTINQTLSATFEADPIPTFDIVVNPGANGSITPGTTTVNEGDNQTFSITPNAGFHILDVLKNGVSQGPVSSVTFSNVTSNQTLSATFEVDPIPTFDIVVNAGANGSISPGTTTVNEGGNQTFTITPNAGFHILDVLKNGVSQGPVSSVTFSNVTSNQTLSATFEEDSTGQPENMLTNGDFSMGTTAWQCQISSGATASCNETAGIFNIDINDGGTSAWHVQPRQNNITLVSGQTYTFAFDASAASNRSTQIKIERDSSPWEDFTQIGSGQNLTTTMQRFVYTFTMNTTLDHARVVLNIGANDNDVFVDNVWLVEGGVDPCGGFVGCGEPVVTHEISVSHGTNGSISPSTLQALEGSSHTFTITADSGYQILDVVKNGVSLGAVSTITFDNVTEAQTLFASFEESNEPPAPILIEAEDYSSMQGIRTQIGTEGVNVGWIGDGDWMRYDVNIPQSGSYTIEYRVASRRGGGDLVLQDGSDNNIGSSLVIPRTGGWQNWTTIQQTVNLDAGLQTIRIFALDGGWNINWFRITAN